MYMFWRICRRYWMLLLISFLSLYLLYTLVAFFIPINYQSIYYSIHPENGKTTLYYKLILSTSTSHAFLPNENIVAEAKLFGLNNSFNNTLSQSDIYILFASSHQNCKGLLGCNKPCDSDNMSRIYLKKNISEDNGYGDTLYNSVMVQAEGCARIRLNGEFDKNGDVYFKGETNVLYKTPGIYKVYVIMHPLSSKNSSPFLIETTDITIDIGSTVDYFNLKNNKLILALSLIGLLFSIKALITNWNNSRD